MTSVFSYFTAVATEATKCAGRASLEGYRTGIADLFVFPLFSAAVVVMVAAIERSKRIKDFLTNYDYSVFEFASVQLTLGTFVICCYLFAALLTLGLVTAFSATRYNAISKYCSGSAALHDPIDGPTPHVASLMRATIYPRLLLAS
jgi:hypothetical protein